MNASIVRSTLSLAQKPVALVRVASLSVMLVLTGCATQSITASLPQNPGPGEPSRIDGTPSTVYGLIASGASACWFAPTGQLKKTHVFYADADSPAKGGAAEIAVHERDAVSGRPWGLRVFKVQLKPSGEQSVIDVENIKMPEPMAGPMRADVFDWAQGGKGCRLKPLEVVLPPVASKPKKKVKTKAITAKAP